MKTNLRLMLMPQCFHSKSQDTANAVDFKTTVLNIGEQHTGWLRLGRLNSEPRETQWALTSPRKT